MDAKTYTIRTPKDFLRVPEDRLPECLQEFGLWLAVGRACEGLLGDIPIANDPFETFVWIDDGKGEVTFTVSTSGEEIHREVFRS